MGLEKNEDLGDSWTIASNEATGGIRRRTIVKGAAWSIPVIAASTALPAAAASTSNLSITLTQTAPPVSLCGTYSDVVFNVKQNGVAAPNQLVTILLSGGVTFADGSTTKVVQSDASGNVTVSGLVATGASGAVTAQAGSATASTGLASLASGVFTSVNGSAWDATPNTIPGDIDFVDVGNSNWVVKTTDGLVYQTTSANNDSAWSLVANPAGVTMTAVEVFTSNRSLMAIGSDGRAYSSQNGSAWMAYPGVSNVKQVSLGNSTWMALDESGVAYWWNNAATANPTLNTLTNPPGVTMTKIKAFESGNYWVGLGSDGKAYQGRVGSPWTPMVGSVNTDIVDVGIGSRTYVAKNSAGQVFVADEYNLPLRPITGPSPIKDMKVWYGGNWMVAVGEDGNPYWWQRGSSQGDVWTRMPGTPDGQVTEFTMGSSAWVALTADGTAYKYFGSGPQSGGTLTPITGTPKIKTLGLHDGGTYVIGAAVSPSLPCAVPVDGFQVNGTCALLGTLGPGFTVAAGSTAIPVGTEILLESTGLLNANVISLSGQGLADVSVLSNNRIKLTLTQAIPAGQQMNIRWLLSIAVLTTTTATLTLPAGYTAGTGTKPQGGLRQTLVLCTPS